MLTESVTRTRVESGDHLLFVEGAVPVRGRGLEERLERDQVADYLGWGSVSVNTSSSLHARLTRQPLPVLSLEDRKPSGREAWRAPGARPDLRLSTHAQPH